LYIFLLRSLFKVEIIFINLSNLQIGIISCQSSVLPHVIGHPIFSIFVVTLKNLFLLDANVRLIAKNDGVDWNFFFLVRILLNILFDWSLLDAVNDEYNQEDD
jgi:hypothetical protein